jgi:hypothetical protein
MLKMVMESPRKKKAIYGTRKVNVASQTGHAILKHINKEYAPQMIT